MDRPAIQESWVFGANDPQLGMGLNHLPLTAFVDEESGQRHLGVGIGACVLDLALAADSLPQAVREAARQPSLNALMESGPAAWAEFREALQRLLSRANRAGSTERRLIESALRPARILRLEVPCSIGDYTDFYASRDHARRVGEIFRPESPLLENYGWMPIAYHGRASSIVASGAAVRRPAGQVYGADGPRLRPTSKLDFELELGFVVGQGNALGEPVPVEIAEDRLFGVSLLNDWSARDVQAWEYRPLGPFLGKNFCTTLSPWITPLAALAGMRTRPGEHADGTLDYLRGGGSGVSLRLEVWLSTERSRAAGLAPFCISTSNSADLFWTPAQMVAHHTVGGCNLRPGDLLGTGTISGADRGNSGCLLELTSNGTEPLTLPSGERRAFLEDGDEVRLEGWGDPEGQLPIRLGECLGRIAPSLFKDRPAGD